ncbi:MAG TPA: cation:proton antiporter [Acidimicrobiales bacterium]|jgi:Na+:H+ antiporter|nr:cation:proton antiporter [Acidimicrobiales bacterium]
MNVSTVLFDVLVVLIAAKLAAEVSERVGVPAVIGEIIAGVLIGPSVLGIVGGSDEVLRTLGEIGVILLLLQVGLEMDLQELGAVGRTSLLVATVGVVVPLLLGLGAMQLVGDDFKTSLFVASALTATSVGITARVFGDLRALATTEARIVLGAAVADDVMGLVVLTVVVRLVTQGSVSFLSVSGIVLIAVGFLVVGGFAGLRLAPPLFALVERVSRSTGTMVALALAFTLAFAQLADAAKLAPIVGAFVAGLALARSEQSERISRELAPVGHLFIPVFFLQIGIDAQIDAFARVGVLRDAAILLVVAVVGKLVSPLGAIGSPGDKLLIGLGMLPRGEVGLIFATIGLQTGVLDDDLYAALLLVVLVTTLVTPQLLKIRYGQLRRDPAHFAPSTGDPMPAEGWLSVVDGVVVLRARPPAHLGLEIAFEAAARMTHARPSPALLDWLSSIDPRQLTFGRAASPAFLALVERGNARSWRFLDTLGVLETAVPELSQALRDRAADPFELDPAATHRWTTIERLRAIDDAHPLAPDLQQLAHPEWLFLAALLADAVGDRPDGVAVARRLVGRLELGAAAEQQIALLVEDRDLFLAAIRQPDGLGEASVLALASHLDTPERARALYILSCVRTDGLARWEYEQLRELHDLVQEALALPDLTGLDARNLVGRRRAQATRVAGDDPAIMHRIETAPRAYVLAVEGDVLARHAELLSTLGRTDRVTVRASTVDAAQWLDVAAFDRPGLLAAVTSVLAAQDLDIEQAIVATWDDGRALESFRLRDGLDVDSAQLRDAIDGELDAPLAAPPIADALVTFDDAISPWHTLCEVRASDKPGLLHALATGFAAADVSVHAARMQSEDALAVDRFELTDATGRKLAADDRERVARYIAAGVVTTKRRWHRARVQAADPTTVTTA